MTSDILVTGGTGTLGRPVVRRLQDAGAKVRVLSRRSREAGEGVEYVTGDLATGQGIEAAVDGAEIIVHCAGSNKGDEDKARNLVRAAARAGTRHLVYISVVGADRVPVVSAADRAMFGYFASKLAAERVVAGSGLSTPARSPTSSWSWPSAPRPGSRPTSRARGCTRCPSCSMATCGLPASAARWCRSRFRGRPPARSGPA